MRTKIGLWIDHRQAVVVALQGRETKTELIMSRVEKQLRRDGDSPLKGPFESQKVPADNLRQKAYTADLNVYYDAVIAHLGDAESVLVFGPGEAKDELKRRIDEKQPDLSVVAVETADQMTEPQITAKVRDYFAD